MTFPFFSLSLSLPPPALQANKRQAVWEADLKSARGGSSVGQTGLLLGDSLFSKELENMGKQLAGRHSSRSGSESTHGDSVFSHETLPGLRGFFFSQ